MNYTKPMIELVYEIRRKVPYDLKPSVKLANPELFHELITYYYQKDTTTVAKTLIKELLSLAGEDWLTALTAYPNTKMSAHDAKIYRGSHSLEERKPAPEPKPKPKNHRQKIYRGQIVP